MFGLIKKSMFIIIVTLLAIPVSGISINDAVDNYALSFKTGILPWFGQPTIYNYGGSAAQSGAISDGQTSWFGTNVVGHMRYLTFNWKVSSEERFDSLNVYLDGELMDSISGDVDWQKKAYYIPTSSHSIDWKYEKDGSVSAGSDAGWVDKVEFISSWAGALINEALDNYNLEFRYGGVNDWFGEPFIWVSGGSAFQTGYIWDNQNTYFDAYVTGPGTISFYWKVSSEPDDYLLFYIDNVVKGGISGNVDWQQQSFAVPSGSHTLRWSYKKDRGLTGGSDAGWVDKVEFIGSIMGDIDGNGQVTSNDALLYLRYAVGQNISPFNIDPVRDDVTCDDIITSADALKILRKAVGQNVDLICHP
jgi:hypothetical protein